MTHLPLELCDIIFGMCDMYTRYVCAYVKSEWREYIQSNYEIKKPTLNYAISLDSPSMVGWILEDCKSCREVVNVGDLIVKGKVGILSVLKEKRTFFGSNKYICAVKSGDINVLKWVLDNLYTTVNINDKSCYEAVSRGNIEMLKLLRNPGPDKIPFPWSSECYSKAVKNGDIEMVRFLMNLDDACPFTKDCVIHAIIDDRIDILELLSTIKPVPIWSLKCHSIAIAHSSEKTIEWLNDPNTGGGSLPRR